jgi:hypothetical protein
VTLCVQRFECVVLCLCVVCVLLLLRCRVMPSHTQAAVKQVISDLLQNKLDLSLLVISKVLRACDCCVTAFVCDRVCVRAGIVEGRQGLREQAGAR